MHDFERAAGVWLSIVLGAASLSPASGYAATPDNYQAKTTADMVALCGTDPAAPDYATAIAFCHGFAVGAYQYYLRVTAARPNAQFVCLPNPSPPRSQMIVEFVAWARTRPDVMTAAPVDSMFRYLGEHYPCAK